MNKLRRILVVDGSRVVRATLTKHLKDDFEILEEGDGESAWQTLMLDASIAAVITGIHTPKLEAHDLLARLSASSIRRLREIPFVLITSDVDNQAEREFDRTLGVAGFITKSMKKSEIVEYLNNLLDSVVFTQSVILPEAPKEEVPPPFEPSFEPLFKPQKLLERDKFQSILSGISFSDPQVGKVCALVIGIDNREALISSIGEDAAEVISARIASLLLSRVGPLDSIGRSRGDQLAVISHGVDLEQGMRFGNRVCKSLASGQITIRGKKVRLTASVGVASNSDDNVAGARELFALAEQRLDQALVCGGNTVISEVKPGCPLRCQNKITSRLIEALSEQGEKNIATHLGALGLKILPLLKAMDKELALGLPLADIKQKLQQRAKTEENLA